MAALARVAVLGAGAMGARIAELFADAGLSVLLLDLAKPLAQAHASIETASFEEGVHLLRDADWVLEAVVEDLQAKRDLWRKVSAYIPPRAIASTNTSGLSIAAIAEGLPGSFQHQFLGVHFFNPPAKLHLVEAIRTPQTSPEVFLAATRFVTERLGKGVVEARDTPNFIANRIGAYFSAKAQSLAVTGAYTVEETDLMTGALIGMPRTGTFRLMDVIGLDVWARVLETSGLEVQPYLREMLRRGWLGAKTGGGFYRKTASQAIEALDLQTLEYRAAFTTGFGADSFPPLPQRLSYLLSRNDRISDFLNPLFPDLIAYCHETAPLIANSPSDLDLAMRWGYGWTLGPFEIESAIT